MNTQHVCRKTFDTSILPVFLFGGIPTALDRSFESPGISNDSQFGSAMHLLSETCGVCKHNMQQLHDILC